jgi:hypothetical protein
MKHSNKKNTREGRKKNNQQQHSVGTQQSLQTHICDVMPLLFRWQLPFKLRIYFQNSNKSRKSHALDIALILSLSLSLSLSLNFTLHEATVFLQDVIITTAITTWSRMTRQILLNMLR